MTDKLYTHAELLQMLVERKGDDLLIELADEIGVAKSTLSNVLNGHRRIDGKILEFMGMEKVTRYIYKRKELK